MLFRRLVIGSGANSAAHQWEEIQLFSLNRPRSALRDFMRENNRKSIREMKRVREERKEEEKMKERFEKREKRKGTFFNVKSDDVFWEKKKEKRRVEKKKGERKISRERNERNEEELIGGKKERERNKANMWEDRWIKWPDRKKLDKQEKERKK